MDPTSPRLRRLLHHRWDHLTASRRSERSDQLWELVRSEHPRFTTAVAADARITATRRGERADYRSRLDLAIQVMRLCLVTESFLGQCCYRAKAHCQARRIPLLPRFLNRLAVRHGQIAIGDPVVVRAGVYVPHGQVVVDGLTTIGVGVVLSPFTTIGLVAGDYAGPTIGDHVDIGTGARVLGPCTIGARATIGANAVVLDDVPAGATAVGVPARVLA